METLLALEEKVKALVLHAKDMKNKIAMLEQENGHLSDKNKELKTENDAYVESNAQLKNQLNALENSILLESGHVDELKEERSMTRSVLDDLIKSIDSIVENEN
jgi:chromosome segregation ATPase